MCRQSGGAMQKSEENLREEIESLKKRLTAVESGLIRLNRLFSAMSVISETCGQAISGEYICKTQEKTVPVRMSVQENEALENSEAELCDYRNLMLEKADLEQKLSEKDAKITSIENDLAEAREKNKKLGSRHSADEWEIKGLMRDRDTLKQEKADLEQKLSEKDAAITKLENELAAEKEKINSLESENAKIKGQLNKEQEDKKQLQNGCDKLILDKARLEAKQLPEQEQLHALWEKISNMPEAEKNILSVYFDLSTLSAIISGAGQFARLEQLWQACAGKTASGSEFSTLPDLLESLLGLYNSANVKNPASLVSLRPGSGYDYGRADRIGTNGSLVDRLLLPGLARPDGQIAVKCLVSLK